jgi:filamentous hemagglutinin family protein
MREEQQALSMASDPVAPKFNKTLLYHLSKLAFAHKSSNESHFLHPQRNTTRPLHSHTHLDEETCSYAIAAYKGLLTVDNALRKIAQCSAKSAPYKNLSLAEAPSKQTLFYHLAKLSLIESSLRQSLPGKLNPVTTKGKQPASVTELRQQLIERWQKNGMPLPLLSKTLFEQLIVEAVITDHTVAYLPEIQRPPLLVKTLYHLLSVALITGSVHSYAVPALTALPSGGSVSAGSASISTQGNQMIINQSSDKVAINWSSFNIGANASVTFQQPNHQSVALNRIASADPSQIYGNLNANGQVILINPNGVVVGPGANVNVGAMIVSTLALSDSDFMAGNYRFTTPSVDSLHTLTPQIINQGNVVAGVGGYVQLIGHDIQNQGTLSAPGGTVGLLAGDTVTLNLSSEGQLLPATLTAAVNADAVIENSGTITADQGAIQLRVANAGVGGNDIHTNPLTNTVVIDQSGSLTSVGGTILIDGGITGIVQQSGTLSTANTDGVGGNISVLGDKIGLMANSVIDASGSQGGGTVLVGGNWHGAGPEHNASAVYMDPLARIQADATDNGNGGEVVLWSNNYTGFYGAISAKGGVNGGDGGQVETSSRDNLQAMGKVNTLALLGKGGTWLLDPADVTITNATSANLTCGSNCSNVFQPTGSTSATVNVDEVNAALSAGTDVTITTANGSASTIMDGRGHLYVNSPINISGAASATSATLTLIANLDITLNANITASGNNKLNLYLIAFGANKPENTPLIDPNTNSPTIGEGPVIANHNIDTNGGYLKF